MQLQQLAQLLLALLPPRRLGLGAHLWAAGAWARGPAAAERQIRQEC